MNARRLNRMGRRAVMAVAITAALAGAAAVEAAERRYVLPEGTVIPLKLDQTINSKDARRGQRFTASVRQDDYSGLPWGTRVEGTIASVSRSRNDRPGELDLDFHRIVLPDGKTASVDGYLYALDNNSVRRDSSGYLVATGSRSNDRLKWVGIGAGAGALVGVLTKGNTLLDALIGAGAGYLYGELQGKGKPGDVNLRSGTEFGLRLDRQLAFNLDDRYYSGTAYGRYTDAHGYEPGRPGEWRDGYAYDRPGYRLHRSDAPVTVWHNNRHVLLSGEGAYIEGGVAYVPFVEVAKELGGRHRFNERRGVIVYDGARMQLNASTMRAGSRNHTLSGRAFMRGGTVYVPAEFFQHAQDGDMKFDADRRRIEFTTRRNNWNW